MLFEQALYKKEKEQQRNLKHQVEGKCQLTRLVDSSKDVEDVANVKCVQERPSSCRKSKASKSSSKSSTSGRSSTSKDSRLSGKDSGNASQLAARAANCFERPTRRRTEACSKDFKWQHGQYYRDECGSGIRPLKMTFAPNRKLWCATPLSMYQSTIGELARKILCDEFKVQRDINGTPPCNVCEYSLPLCRGYYRKYDCIRPCEEEFARRQNGHKVYRDRVQRYWEPCLMEEQKPEKSVRQYAQHNAYLGDVVRRKFQDSVPCW